MEGAFHLHLEKPDFKFNAAHFVVFGVSVQVTLPVASFAPTILGTGRHA
jgi:hypothetical protein